MNHNNPLALSEWLKTTLKKRKVSQAELGRLLTKKLGRNIDHAAANKMANGQRVISAEELLEIEKILGETAPDRHIEPYNVRDIDGVYYDEYFISDTLGCGLN